MEDNYANEKINALANLLVNDYCKKRAIDEVPIEHIDRSIIIEIVKKIKMVIYPGYYEKNGDDQMYNTINNVAILLRDIFYNLNEQVSIALNFCKDNIKFDRKRNVKSEQIVIDFLNKIPKIRKYLDTDIDAIFNNDPAAYSKSEIIYAYPGLFAISVYRVAHELYLLNVPLIPRIMTEYAHNMTGIDIHTGVTIGEYFCIDHGTGIVIGETSVIGNNVKIYQNVTFGALSTKGGQKLQGIKRHPTSCDNVTIYSGASILGGKTIVGKNSTIGGNVFVTSSVPPNSKLSFKNRELKYNFNNSNKKH